MGIRENENMHELHQNANPSQFHDRLSVLSSDVCHREKQHHQDVSP